MLAMLATGNVGNERRHSSLYLPTVMTSLTRSRSGATGWSASRSRASEWGPLPVANGRLLPASRLVEDSSRRPPPSASFPLLVAVGLDGLPEELARNARFFPGFVERRLLVRVAGVDETLWYSMTRQFSGGSGRPGYLAPPAAPETPPPALEMPRKSSSRSERQLSQRTSEASDPPSSAAKWRGAGRLSKERGVDGSRSKPDRRFRCAIITRPRRCPVEIAARQHHLSRTDAASVTPAFVLRTSARQARLRGRRTSTRQARLRSRCNSTAQPRLRSRNRRNPRRRPPGSTGNSPASRGAHRERADDGSRGDGRPRPPAGASFR